MAGVQAAQGRRLEARRRPVPALKLAVLQNVVAPTRHALFRALAERVDLTVYFMARDEPTRDWRGEAAGIDYPHFFLRGLHLPLPRGGDVDALHLNPSVGRAIRAGEFEALLCSGYLSPSSWLALRACRRGGVRFLLWSGSSWPTGGIRARVATPLKRAFVRGSDGVIVYGALSRDRILELGGRPERVHVVLNTTHVEPFARAAATRSADDRVVLWVGRFVARKRPLLALSLLARIAERVPGVRAVFVGDGPERARVQAAARTLGLSIDFPGSVPYDRMPEVYARAAILLAPFAREQWGLVVNEALAAGVAVLASPEVAAARELLPPGAGLVSAVEQDLVDEAVRLLEMPHALAAARQSASAVLPELLPERWAAGVAAAARATLR